MDWIKSVRPKTVLIGIFLYTVACSINNWQGFSWPILALIFFLGMYIMAGNDWDDREKDVIKGKTFAKRIGKKYLRFVYFLWALATVTVIYIALTNSPIVGIYSIFLWMVCSWYSVVRNMKYIPGLYVSLIASGAVVFPLIKNPLNKDLWILSICVLFVVYAREIIKDLHDLDFDKGYKWTLPTSYGIRLSKFVIMLCLVLGVVCAVFIDPRTIYAISIAIIPLTILLLKDYYGLTKFTLDLMILGAFGILMFV